MHAAVDGTIRLLWLAVVVAEQVLPQNALSVPEEKIKLVAMGDVFEHRQKASYESLVRKFPKSVDVP